MVKIMFPTISSFEEWRIAKGIVEEVKELLRAESSSFDKKIEVGIMVEVPSVDILAKQFAKRLFFSCRYE